MPVAPAAYTQDFLAGGGEMGALMRAHDWSASPLGPPETWPQSLRTVVSLLLNSKFPMFVAWGPELAFLYNDHYAEILGAKHPAALGRRFQDIWFEIWSDISPLVNRALHGEATYHENLPLTMLRKGFEEQTYFTFSYSPVRDESGGISGMFCACTETTSQVIARRLREPPHRPVARPQRAHPRELGGRQPAQQAVEPYSQDREDRLHLAGADIRLTPRMALALAMALQYQRGEIRSARQRHR